VTVDRIAALQDLEREVGVLMRRSRRVIRERAQMLHPELSAQEYLLLSYIKAYGPSRGADVADAFQLDKGAVSRAIHVLLRLGLVEKQADPEDGRAMRLSATPEVAERLDEIARLRLARLQERLDSWSDEDIAGFVGAFSRYNDLLDESMALQAEYARS
jgi:DNA-binding MarR family transcriptional regulator